MVWSAEAEAKVWSPCNQECFKKTLLLTPLQLMASIFKVCDVKITEAQKVEMAKLMGSECTAKAITHRLAKMRELAKGSADAPKEENEAKPKKAAKAPKATANGTKKNAKGAKKAAAARTPSPAGDDDIYPTPDTPRPKRGGPKRNYAEMNGGEGSDAVADEADDDGLSKKVKIEVGEDIGEGLRQAPDEDDQQEMFTI